MKNTQTNHTEPHGITLKDRLIQLAILTGTIGIAVASVATGISAPLGLVTTSMEMARIAPQFEKFNKTRVGRALKFTADVIFAKPVVRAFKLTVPILGIAGLSIATGGIAPAIALAITCTSMAYKIGREVYELRKTRKLEQQLTSVNAINTAKKAAEQGPLMELQDLGIEIPTAPIKTIVATHHDAQQDSKLKTFLKASAFSLIESTGSVVKAFIGDHPLERAVTSLFTMGGVGKETEITLKVDQERHQMKQQIIAAGGTIPYDQDQLKAEEKAHQKYAESLMMLTRNAKTFQLSKDEIQQRFNVINETLQTQLQAPPVKEHIVKRVAHKILQVFKDIAEIHKPNISDPRAIFAKDPNDPRYNIDHSSSIHRVTQAQQEKEQYYQRLAQNISVGTQTKMNEAGKTTIQDTKTTQEIKTQEAQVDSGHSSHTISDISSTHTVSSEHNASPAKVDKTIKQEEVKKEVSALQHELTRKRTRQQDKPNPPIGYTPLKKQKTSDLEL